MHGYWLAVNALAVYRLSILLSKDKITERLRRWVWRRGWYWTPIKGLAGQKQRESQAGRMGRVGRWAWELVICPWCLSVWWGACAVTLTATVPRLWEYPALALALSGVTVLATRREE